MCDKMAISAYILKIVEKDPFLRLQMRAKEMFNRHQFFFCLIVTNFFTRLSVFDSPKGSSNTFKTHKNISLYFKRRYLITYNYQNI